MAIMYQVFLILPTHPANSSLGDLVLLLSTSPIRFIQSNYNETYDWNSQQSRKILSEYADFPLHFCYRGDEPIISHHHLVFGTLGNLEKL